MSVKVTHPLGMAADEKAGTRFDEVPLRHLFSVVNGATPDSQNEDFWGGAIPWVTPEDLSNRVSPKISETKRTITQAGYDACGTTLVPSGSVVISTRAPIGNIAIAARSLCTNQGCRSLVPLANLSQKFFYYQLSVLNHELNRLGRGTTFLELSSGDLAAFKVHVPPLPEQTRIANFLDEQTARIDALIAEKERLRDACKDSEEVTAFDLVVHGNRVAGHRTNYREPWLKAVPAHWGLTKLRNVAVIGNGSTPRRDNGDYWQNGEIPWLNSGSVNSSRICLASDFVSEQARKECHLPMVRAGSTLVALTGQGKTRGSAALTEIEATINQHLAYVSLFDNQISDEYLWVVLTGFYSVLRYISEGEGSTKGALTCERLNQLRIPVPPVHEQTSIRDVFVARITAMGMLRKNIEESIVLLHEYRSSLISAAVTGQLNPDRFEGCV